MKKLLLVFVLVFYCSFPAMAYDTSKPGQSIDTILNPVTVELSDPTSKEPLLIDPTFTALVSMDIAHHEIHECCHFFTKTFAELVGGAGVVTYFMFITPPGPVEVNAKASFYADVEVELEIYEGAVVSDNGTEIDVEKNKRSCVDEPLIRAFVGPTVTDPGEEIWKAKTGSAKDATGVAPGFSYEIIVLPDTNYLWKVTKTAVQEGYIDADFWGYEHTPDN
jgi:hypothetical protein